jgi:hypothetical protein
MRQYGIKAETVKWRAILIIGALSSLWLVIQRLCRNIQME